MLKYILLIVMLAGCSAELPPCPQISKEDYKIGLTSRNLGSVNIDGEQCQIFEQYNKNNCSVKTEDSFRNRPLNCSGPAVECYEEILTRVTKCPSGFVTNTITYSQDKFHTEQIR